VRRRASEAAGTRRARRSACTQWHTHIDKEDSMAPACSLRPAPSRSSASRTGTLLAALSLAVLLAACGGDDDDTGDAAPPPVAEDPARGSLIEGQAAATVPRQITDALIAQARLSGIAAAARCDVTVHAVRYNTRDPLNAAHTASAAVLVPGGDDAACQGSRPVVLYARGTDVKKSKNMADVQSEEETALMTAFFAAQGQIVVLPNYLGHDTSSLDYHPFLNAEAQAVDVIDALRAARTYLATTAGTQASDKLFIAGYSQGGHVAMAAQRAIERDHVGEFTVTASAPMSGPYNMVEFGDVIFDPDQPRINDGATVFLTLLLTGYQRSFGNVYAAPSDAYNAPFDLTAETLFPTDISLGTLVAEGKLPASTEAVFGAGGLLTDGFRAAYPTSAFRQDLQANSLLDWTPQAPMALCGGAEDPVVFFDINTAAAQAAFAARGVAVPAFNLEDRATLPDGAAADAVAQSFAAFKAAGAGSYHGTLVAPHCFALASQFFEGK
jgi:hypothetical protein